MGSMMSPVNQLKIAPNKNITQKNRVNQQKQTVLKMTQVQQQIHQNLILNVSAEPEKKRNILSYVKKTQQEAHQLYKQNVIKD